jgi:hypothetical protein
VRAEIARRKPKTTVDVKPKVEPIPPLKAAVNTLRTIRTKISIHPSIEFNVLLTIDFRKDW